MDPVAEHTLYDQYATPPPVAYGREMGSYVKRRELPVPGSVPDALQMFRTEVRFYREVAAVVGIRVPPCHAEGEVVA